MHHLSKLFISAAALATAFTLQADIVKVNVLTDDAQVLNNSTISSTTGETARAGYSTNKPAYVAVISLADIGTELKFSTANFRVRSGTTGGPSFNGDLYGLGYRTSPTVLATDYYTGSSDPNATLIQDDYLSGLSSSFSTVTTDNAGDAALADYLNAQYTASATDRLNGEDIYVFLRINGDVANAGWQYYNISTANESDAYSRPFLEYDTATIPEAGTFSLILISGIALICCRRKLK